MTSTNSQSSLLSSVKACRKRDSKEIDSSKTEVIEVIVIVVTLAAEVEEEAEMETSVANAEEEEVAVEEIVTATNP